MKNKKGFTLIELLAVIVILGLLMAIAIPSVTKYITESRKKTVVSTIGNYITAMVNEVNDLTYTFTGENTIYAVPVECIALERGGTNPFGAWHQSNDAYWAYVLVQYDDETSSYRYGYTFKDSAGYGIYPTAQAKLNEQGKQIQTGLSLTRPKNGKITSITDVDNWNGFNVDSSTDLVVLVAESEGNVGDGKYTCTLQQKGDNYLLVEEEKEEANKDDDTSDNIENKDESNNKENENNFSNTIQKNNNIITKKPTLNLPINQTSDESGLYSDKTNNGITYYFRGDVKNNYVNFAGLMWRIVRINEDSTVRLILTTGLSTSTSYFDSANDSYYYSESSIRNTVSNWYNSKLKSYDSYIIAQNFCQQARVRYADYFSASNAVMEIYTSYKPSFDCATDGNGMGKLSQKIGLITYDEVVYAGGYPDANNSSYYLYDSKYSTWTISPVGDRAGFSPWVWHIGNNGDLHGSSVYGGDYIRPVINLKSDVTATGTGTSSDPYVIKTN